MTAFFANGFYVGRVSISMSVNASSNTPSAAVAAEQRARDFLGQKKWRKARDEAKPLVKADRDRYLPLLIQANLGLAREMMDKGLVSEAQQVLSYLASIASAGQLRTLELELAGQGKANEDTLSKFLEALADTQTSLPVVEQVRVADQLVLAFKPVTSSEPAQAALAAELRAVQESLLAVSQSLWDRLPDLLRPIPRRSPFSHWAAFIKGQAAFYTGDNDKATRHFSGLPPESVPGKASHAYRLLAGEEALTAPGPTANEVILGRACQLTGVTMNGPALWRADALWKQRRFVESYQAVREAAPGFPSRQLNWLGTLTEFYCKAPHGLGFEEREPLMRYFDNVLKPGQKRNQVEALLACRLFALIDGATAPTYGLRQDWEGFLRAHEALHGVRPQLASMVYGHLGEMLAQRRPVPRMFYCRKSELRDAHGALEALQKSIALDPSNLSAHLKLCEVYGALKQTSERNRLLDGMTQQFPDEKQVLLLAGQLCMERKAFVKGMGYLERARQLDRLDPAVPELMLVTLRRQARQYFQQRRAEKGRQTLAQIEEFLTDTPDDFQRSRWTALARQGLMEQLWGDLESAEALLRQARERSPLPELLLFFLHLCHRVYTRQYSFKSPFLAELKAALKVSPTVAGANLLLRVTAYWQSAMDAGHFYQERDLTVNYLRAAADADFSREEAAEAIDRAGGDVRFEDVLRALVKKVLKRDRLDPKFRLYDLTLVKNWTWNPEQSRRKLKSIADDAARRHDDGTARMARQLIKELELPPPAPPMPFDPEFLDEPPDELEDEPNWPEDLNDMANSDLPSGDMEGLAAILDIIGNASDSEIRRLRKTRPKGMPGSVFDSLVEAAKMGPPPLPPLPPDRAPGAPRKPLPPVDPNQLNLF